MTFAISAGRAETHPLMRISTGVRNLIAGGGGGGGGEAPPAAPPPAAGGTVAEGADATSTTLAAGRGVAEMGQSGLGAGRLDDVTAPIRGADEIGHSDNLSEIRRSAATAEQLERLKRGEIGNVVETTESTPPAGPMLADPRSRLPQTSIETAEVARGSIDGFNDTHRAADAHGSNVTDPAPEVMDQAPPAIDAPDPEVAQNPDPRTNDPHFEPLHSRIDPRKLGGWVDKRLGDAEQRWWEDTRNGGLVDTGTWNGTDETDIMLAETAPSADARAEIAALDANALDAVLRLLDPPARRS